jgi:hypothetical protein
VKLREIEAWVLRQQLADRTLNGELELLSGPVRRLADHLETVPHGSRQIALDGFLCVRRDADEWIAKLAAVNASGPPPPVETIERCASLADVRPLVSATGWPWPGWLAGGVLNAVAADPGTGKTILGMDLARRLFLGLTWPDGQANPFPAGTKTLWVPGDRHFPQLLHLADRYGIPDEVVLINAPAHDPTSGLDLDDSAELAALAKRIEGERPGLVIVDTVGMTTGRNLCRPEDARAYFSPLMEIAQRCEVAFLCLTHLSKDGESLGRRIDGATRAVWKMTKPNPEGEPNRRRVWVSKTYSIVPPPLGMTIGDAGCEFDFNPPEAPEPIRRKPGPPPEKLEACKAWLSERLGPNPARVSAVRKDAEKAEFPVATLYKAKDALGIEELVLERKKWWKLPEAPEASAGAPEGTDPEAAF